jgi:hypothetical protein
MVSTIGVTIHRHYCGSSLVATSFLPHGDADACDTDMPMNDDSCTDNHLQFNVDSPLVLLTFGLESVPAIEWVKASEVLFVNLYSKDFTTPTFYADISPPPSEPNIYTRVQSFLL